MNIDMLDFSHITDLPGKESLFRYYIDINKPVLVGTDTHFLVLIGYKYDHNNIIVSYIMSDSEPDYHGNNINFG